MKIRINGQEMPCSGMQVRGNDTLWNGRESRAVTLPMTYAEALALFVDDVPWVVISEGVGEDGAAYTSERDMSDFALAGPITDNRDGTVTVKMGKALQDEIVRITLAEAPKTMKEARAWRNIIEDMVQHVPADMYALHVVPLFREWKTLIGYDVFAGYRLRHDGKLYRVITPHTVQAEHAPGIGTESLYTRIDKAHSGTADDPIPYEGNMALTAGLHYTQNGVVYRCTRDTGNPVYHALADLVGLYVEVVA